MENTNRQEFRIGFQCYEVPLGLVRAMVIAKRCGEGAQQFVNDHAALPDLIVVGINESNNELFIVKDKDGNPMQFDAMDPAPTES